MERALYEQMENCMLDAMEGGAHDGLLKDQSVNSVK